MPPVLNTTLLLSNFSNTDIDMVSVEDGAPNVSSEELSPLLQASATLLPLTSRSSQPQRLLWRLLHFLSTTLDLLPALHQLAVAEHLLKPREGCREVAGDGNSRKSPLKVRAMAGMRSGMGGWSQCCKGDSDGSGASRSSCRRRRAEAEAEEPARSPDLMGVDEEGTHGRGEHKYTQSAAQRGIHRRAGRFAVVLASVALLLWEAGTARAQTFAEGVGGTFDDTAFGAIGSTPRKCEGGDRWCSR
eukprot:1687309-Rhodomonas_salina.1